MTVEITVGPSVLTINRGSAFMVTDRRGAIDETKPQGVFADDTRFISMYQLYINDRQWKRVTSACVTYYAARLELTNPKVLTTDGKGTIKKQTLALTLQREIDTALHESFHITNYSQEAVNFMLELVIRSDFADLFQVKAGRLTRRAHVKTAWDDQRRQLTTSYHLKDFERRTVYQVRESTSPPDYANGRLVFDVSLEPAGHWDARCEISMLPQGSPGREAKARTAPGQRPQREHHPASGGDLDKLQRQWLDSCATLTTPNNNVRDTYQQSIEDMGALRLPEHDLGANVWMPAAGVPWFVALFGRDSLIASYQTMIARGAFAEGALRELARFQATERNDWRDAQPGKMPHELRHGELAHFDRIPSTPYYGTADATILYLIVLHEYYKWTGDRKLLEELRPVADRCLQWIDHYGDLDGDGFQEWKTFSKQGFENMDWKDSGTSNVYRDGKQSKQPKGTCELQGYVYDAKLRMAELYAVLGDDQRAKQLRSDAAELQRRFDDAFWMEDEGCYAFGLGADKKQIDAVVSNTGQCLWSGIVPPERARRVCERLFQPDMWCGWGIRTLSAKNPAYNPHSYQRGAVWPHDNGIIAAGLKRYGFAGEANKVAEGIFAAASYFDSFRLPEVFSGLSRKPASFPSQYIGANIPQAWAAGSVLHLIRTLLGLRADAPNGILYTNPTLPDWLPELTLGHLQVGKSALDLRFWRDGDGSHVEVKSRTGPRIEVKQEAEQIPGLAAPVRGPARR